MNLRAQSGLEYLLTYGWALVLIAAVIGVLVFITSSPSTVAFSTSDPTKILMKGGTVSGTDVEIKMQNITGGLIDVTLVTLTSNYSDATCLLNGNAFTSGAAISPAIVVPAGSELYLECSSVAGNGSGTIDIDYTDFSGLQRSVTINANEGNVGEGEGESSQLFESYAGDDVMEMFGFSENYWVGQTFTPSVAHTVTSVKAQLFRYGLPGTLTVGIKNTTDGDPAGADICSGTFDGDSLTSNPAGEMTEIIMSSPCSLSAGTMYAVVIAAPDGEFGERVLIWCSGSIDGYIGGERKDSMDGGLNWIDNPTIDFSFEEWGTLS